MVKKGNTNKKISFKKQNKKEKLVFASNNKKELIYKAGGTIKTYFQKQEKKIVSDQKKQFTWFVLGFLIFYLILSGIAYPFADTLKEGTGRSAEFFLGMQGIETQSIGNIELENYENAYSFEIIPTGQTVFISWLCSGALEIIILISAILASFGISWRKKILGAIVAIIAGYVFNVFRIWITLNIIMVQNTEVFEIAHDLLFRIVLFVYIIVVYVLWFMWAKK